MHLRGVLGQSNEDDSSKSLSIFTHRQVFTKPRGSKQCCHFKSTMYTYLLGWHFVNVYNIANKIKISCSWNMHETNPSLSLCKSEYTSFSCSEGFNYLNLLMYTNYCKMTFKRSNSPYIGSAISKSSKLINFVDINKFITD